MKKTQKKEKPSETLRRPKKEEHSRSEVVDEEQVAQEAEQELAPTAESPPPNKTQEELQPEKTQINTTAILGDIMEIQKPTNEILRRIRSYREIDKKASLERVYNEYGPKKAYTESMEYIGETNGLLNELKGHMMSITSACERIFRELKNDR